MRIFDREESPYLNAEAITMLAPSPRPLALDDAQITTIMRSARVLAPRDRDEFMRSVAQVLQQQPELGDGIVARVCREVQRRYWRAPEVEARGAGGKYSR